jgi:hypothetical protein
VVPATAWAGDTGSRDEKASVGKTFFLRGDLNLDGGCESDSIQIADDKSIQYGNYEAPPVLRQCERVRIVDIRAVRQGVCIHVQRAPLNLTPALESLVPKCLGINPDNSEGPTAAKLALGEASILVGPRIAETEASSGREPVRLEQALTILFYLDHPPSIADCLSFSARYPHCPGTVVNALTGFNQ